MLPPSDLAPFDPGVPDRVKIEKGTAVPCRLCESLFHRVRLTRHYCACCDRAFCEEEHGGTAVGGRGSCLECSGHGT